MSRAETRESFRLSPEFASSQSLGNKYKEASEKQPHPCKKQDQKDGPPKGVFAD